MYKTVILTNDQKNIYQAMTSDDKMIQLKDALALCDVHLQRMLYAFHKIDHLFPLTVLEYNQLSPDDLSYSDLLICRFSKLQTSVGSKLFPSLLDNLGEDIQGLPFIDILKKWKS
ncbi:MAG TPA: hypothetical protein PLD74_09930 [Prolixibacteraceae bacterium]|nr:hypothetical protein [Prolixibacteraceae bacterium]